MMKFLRSQSQTVLIVILGVIGLGFIFYGNSGFLTSAGNAAADYGKIDGTDLTVADLYAAIHNTRNYLALYGGEHDLDPSQVAAQAWSQLLLLHEADRLHIDVSDKELVAYIQARPEFQKNGVYSPDRYQQVMASLQTSRLHLSPDNYATMLHNQLRVEAVVRALFSGIRSPTGDVAAQYEKYFGPAQISYVTFDPKTFAATMKATPDEVAAAYKADPMNPAYRTEEKRKVDYVIFALPPELAKLPQKEKAAAIQALGQKALDFALGFQPDPSAAATVPPVVDFAAQARKAGLTPVTSNFFTATTPPENLPPSPGFNRAAFALTKDDPISKVVTLENGVAVLHLNEIQASELKPLAEVSSSIEKTVLQKKSAQAAQEAAAQASAALEAALKTNPDFKAAAAAQHLAVQTLSSFVPLKTPQSDARLQTIAYATLELPVGGLSKPVPIPTDNTALILHVDNRSTPDPAGFGNFEQRFREVQDRRVRDGAIADWTGWKSRQAGTHPPPHLAEYGGIE